MTSNVGNGLSLLAKGKGLLNGGVEIECIPDYRYGHSLSGKEFIAPSLSVEGRHAKMCKPYSLALPKTYVTRRGHMMLFTAPEDMIIGQGIQGSNRIQQVSNHAAKKLKTVDSLKTATKQYEETSKHNNDSVALKPGCFTSVYLEKLRSVQKTDDKHSEAIPSSVTPPPELPVTESDSGIDSSGSHQTLSTSGRGSSLGHTSSLSTRTDAIVIPHGDDPRPPTQAKVRFKDPEILTTPPKHPQELTDIIFSLPSPQQSDKKSSQRSTTKKMTGTSNKSSNSAKKKPAGKGKQKKSQDTNNPCHGGGKKKQKGKKSKKQQKEQSSKDNDITTSKTEPHPPSDEPHSSSSEPHPPSDEPHPPNQDDCEKRQSVNDKRRAMQSARAKERRLQIEQKRSEAETLRRARAEEEEKQALLRDQLSALAAGEGVVTSQEGEEPGNEELMSHSPPPLSPRPRIDLSTLQEQYETDDGSSLITDKDSKLRHLIDKQREAKLLAELAERERREEEERGRQEQRESEERARLAEEKSIKESIEETRQKLQGSKEVNYKMQLELLMNRQNQKYTSTHFFSYFSYLPTKRPVAGKDKKNSKSAAATKRR